MQKHIAAACGLFLSGILSAQSPITAIGTLTAAPGGFTLAEFHDPSILVQSQGDLSALELNVVLLQGSLSTDGAGNTTIQADIATPSANEFRADPTPRLGTTMELRLDVAAASEFYVYLSTGSSFLPLSAYGVDVAGTFWLDPNILISGMSGIVTSRWRMDLSVPFDPFLAGLEIRWQAAIKDAAGQLLFLNAPSSQILP
jgi:hypothetical protein